MWGRVSNEGARELHSQNTRGTPSPRAPRRVPRGGDSVSQSAPRRRAPDPDAGRFATLGGGPRRAGFPAATAARWTALRSPSRWPAWCSPCASCSPRPGFHSAGLTVQNLLSGWLGSEDAAFVPYHLRRTANHAAVPLALPLGEPGADLRNPGRRDGGGVPCWRAEAAGERPCAHGKLLPLQVPGGEGELRTLGEGGALLTGASGERAGSRQDWSQV